MKIAANNPLPTPKISVSLISNLKSEEVHHENINIIWAFDLGCAVGLLPKEDIRVPKPTAPAGGVIYERLWVLSGRPQYIHISNANQ